MSVTGVLADFSNPSYAWSQYEVAPASGLQEINPGDYLAYSGFFVHAVHTGVAWQKASGAGIAVDRNPMYDFRGAQVNNPALVYARFGKFRVSAHFSGRPLLGVLAFPAFTGSGVNAPSGASGVGALWQTAVPVLISALGVPSRAVALVAAWSAAGNGGTGQMDILLWDRNADYY